MERAVIALLHAEEDVDWTRDVADWLERLVGETVGHRNAAEVISGSEAVDRASEASCAVFLATTDALSSTDLHAAAEEMLDADVAVFPVWRPTDGSVSDLLPERLQLLNAAPWDGDPISLGVHVLAAAGLTESERRVFLSYRRTDTAAMAEQLHTSLTQAGFDVFLDRFAVPPGVDFQERLTQDLADKAFVLLLESANFQSEWTEYEVAYATSHRLGLLALARPNLDDAKLVPAVDEAFRLRLAEDDLSEDKLTKPALDRVLARVEREHARAMRRRREQMLGSLRAKLLSDGCSAASAGPWAVVAAKDGHRSAVFLVTPRRPRPGDLLQLHRTREHVIASVDEPLDASVVHETADIAESEEELLAWIAEPRAFQAVLWEDCALTAVDDQ